MTSIIPISRNNKYHGAYRAECSGILEILKALSILCKQCDIISWEVTLEWDRLSALQSIMLRSKERYTPNGEYSNIISQWLHLKESLPHIWPSGWPRGIWKSI